MPTFVPQVLCGNLTQWPLSDVASNFTIMIEAGILNVKLLLGEWMS